MPSHRSGVGCQVLRLDAVRRSVHSLQATGCCDTSLGRADVRNERTCGTKGAAVSDGMQGRRLQPGQRFQVGVADVGEEEPTLLFEAVDLLVEAPNGSLDGTRLRTSRSRATGSTCPADRGHARLARVGTGQPPLRLRGVPARPGLNRRRGDRHAGQGMRRRRCLTGS